MLNSSPTVLEGPLAALRESEIRLLNDVATTLGDMGESAQADRQRLLDVSQDLRAAFFLVVIIGEFNAGKSSFVNALLGDRLLPMGITPTTEAIELIRHGETINRNPVLRDDGIREWTHPNTGAEGVALVDTPGTGSVFRKHEATAKSFLHRSDLVIFVLSAKRALADTERLYLELAKDYGKKIILVVNQSDLLGDNERSEVRRFIERQVAELLDLETLLFMTSAKEALATLDNQSNGAVEGDPGGIGAVRAHLRGVFSESSPARQKLLAQLDMAERVLNKYLNEAKGRADLVTADTAKVTDVKRELEQQAEGLDTQLRGVRAEIDRIFEGMRQRGHEFIGANLSVRRIGRGVSREALQRDFQEQVVGRALRDINEATNDYINAVIDHSRLYWRGVINRLNELRESLEQELSGLDAGIYAEQRESLEEAIRIAETELKTYSSGRVVEQLKTNFETNMNTFMLSAGAAVVGLIVTILAVLAPGPVVGAGAAALAPVGLVLGAPIAVLGGYAALRYYRRVTDDARKELDTRIDQLQKSYQEALDNLTQKERNRLTQYGNQVLTPVFSRLEVLSQRYAAQQNNLRIYEDQIATLRKGIKESG